MSALLYRFNEERAAAIRFVTDRPREHIRIRSAKVHVPSDREPAEKVYCSTYCYGRIRRLYPERCVEAVDLLGLYPPKAPRAWSVPRVPPFPQAPARKAPLALVLGGADGVWDDLLRFQALGASPNLVVAVNDVGVHYPHRIDHWASLHADKLVWWSEQRPGDYVTWTHYDPYGLCDARVENPGGSSGALGVAVALEMGAARVVLCGVPLGGGGHFFADTAWHEAGRFRREWTENGLTERWQDRVRSMSGWTRDELGEPDEGWLA